MNDDRLRAIATATIEAIVLTMEERGMDEKEQRVFLNIYNKYFQAMVEAITEKGGKA